MPPGGWKTVSVRITILSGLHDMYKEDDKRPENQEFSGWLDLVLKKMIEHYKAQKKYGHFFEFIDIRKGEEVLFFDHFRKENISVTIDSTNKKLICSHDRRSDCAHIGFCLGVPEVYKVLIENGFMGNKKEQKARFLLS